MTFFIYPIKVAIQDAQCVCESNQFHDSPNLYWVLMFKELFTVLSFFLLNVSLFSTNTRRSKKCSRNYQQQPIRLKYHQITTKIFIYKKTKTIIISIEYSLMLKSTNCSTKLLIFLMICFWNKIILISSHIICFATATNMTSIQKQMKNLFIS